MTSKFQADPLVAATPQTIQPNAFRLFLFNIGLFLFSLISTALILEVGVRWLVPEETFWLSSAIYQPVDNKMVSYTFKPNFKGTAFGVDLNTNSLGFRGPEWLKEKPKDTYRIALIGDSHAAGYGVPYQQSVGQILTKSLNQTKYNKNLTYEVLNFAVPAYNSTQQLAVFNQYALPYDPDLVIVLPCNNDHDPTPVADADGWLHGGWQEPTEQTRVIDQALAYLKPQNMTALFEHSRAAFYVHLLLRRHQLAQDAQTQRQQLAQNKNNPSVWMPPLQTSGEAKDYVDNNVYQPLQTLLRSAQQKNIPVIMATFNAVDSYRQLFLTLAEAEQVPYIELLSLFPEVNNWNELLAQFGLGWNSHHNAYAHALWAENLHPLVRETQMAQSALAAL
jgi:hypothetical protein